MTVRTKQHRSEVVLCPVCEGVQADISILSTARLAVGQYARIYPLTGPAMPKLPPGIPSFSSSKQASVVRLKEIIHVESKTAPWISSATNSIENSKKHKDWLNLLLREVLGMPFKIHEICILLTLAVDLKYITASQIVSVSYEGVHRRFSISSLLPMGGNQAENDQDKSVTPPTDDRLVQELGGLTIDGSSPQPRRRGRPDIWLVDWDTAVSIVPPKPKSIRASAAQARHQGHRVNVQSLNKKPIAYVL